MELLGKEINDCQCGKTHKLIPEHIIINENALKELPKLAIKSVSGDQTKRKVLILYDIRTITIAGKRVANEFKEAGWQVFEEMVPDPNEIQVPKCDDKTHAILSAKVPIIDVIIPVGSGVLSDLGKWLAFERKVPFLTFATAASMNGYTSANVAPSINGVKSLVHAVPPYAVVSEPQVLSNAPHEMTVAGLGDVLAKSVSSLDWLLNNLLFNDYYCARSVGLITDIEPLYLEQSHRIATHDPQAIVAMTNALMLTGVAMTMAGTSAPASGGEHLISHSLDIMSAIDGHPHDFHGRQVGVATCMMAALYEKVIQISDSPVLYDPPFEIDKDFWGPVADEVQSKYKEKLPRLHIAKNLLAQPGFWPKVKKQLSTMHRSPDIIRSCLTNANGATNFSNLNINRNRLRLALEHAHQMRARFTVLDLAYIFGIFPNYIDDLIDDWAT